jgi:hypothetical protein
LIWSGLASIAIWLSEWNDSVTRRGWIALPSLGQVSAGVTVYQLICSGRGSVQVPSASEYRQ